MSSRVTHADRTAPKIERRKSCPRRSRRRRRRRREGPHGGKKAERTSSTGAKTHWEWRAERRQPARRNSSRGLYRFFFFSSPSFFYSRFSFFFLLSLAISHQGTMICICVSVCGARRERRREGEGETGKTRGVIGWTLSPSTPRKQIRTSAGASEHHPAGLSLRTKKCRQTGRLVALCPPDGVCGTERPASLLIYSRASSTRAPVGTADSRNEKRNETGKAPMKIKGIDRYLSLAYGKRLSGVSHALLHFEFRSCRD